MSGLLARYTDNPDAEETTFSLEDTGDFLDVLQVACEAIDEDLAFLDRVEEAMDLIDLHDDEAFVSLEGLCGDLLDFEDTTGLPALEALDPSLEASVGDVTDRLSRAYQTTVLSLIKTYDWVTDLVKNSEKQLAKYHARFDSLKRQFNAKKHKLDFTHHKTSYRGLQHYWVNEQGYITDPFGQLRIEKELAMFVLDQYPKMIASEMTKFGQIIKQADYSDVDAFNRTVLNKSNELTHPAGLFKLEYLGGRPYMLNTGFYVSGLKTGNVQKGLRAMGKKRRVYMSRVRSNREQYNEQLNPAPDVTMSTAEIDQLIDDGKWFLDAVQKYFGQLRSMESDVATLKKAVEISYDKAKTTIPKASFRAAPKLAKQTYSLFHETEAISRAVRSLITCYWSPSMSFARRTVIMTKGINYLAGRMVYVAK